MVKGATILRVSGAVDFTNGANIPLAVDAEMAKVVAFKACFVVAGMVSVKGTVYRYSLNGPFRQDLMVQLCVLDGQFDGGNEGGSIIRNVRCLVPFPRVCLRGGDERKWGHRQRRWDVGS